MGKGEVPAFTKVSRSEVAPKLKKHGYSPWQPLADEIAGMSADEVVRVTATTKRAAKNITGFVQGRLFPFRVRTNYRPEENSVLIWRTDEPTERIESRVGATS